MPSRQRGGLLRQLSRLCPLSMQNGHICAVRFGSVGHTETVWPNPKQMPHHVLSGSGGAELAVGVPVASARASAPMVFVIAVVENEAAAAVANESILAR